MLALMRESESISHGAAVKATNGVAYPPRRRSRDGQVREQHPPRAHARRN